MKILYIAHERKLGGASLSLATLIKEMKMRGHEVAAVVPFYFSPLAKEIRKQNVQTYWVFNGWWMQPKEWPRYMKFAFRMLYALEKIAVKRIAGIAKRNGFQIIHSNSSVIDVGSRAAKAAGCQHVWHFREFGEPDYQLEYIKGRENSLKMIEEGDDNVVFISKVLQDYYKDLNVADRGHVIYNGISPTYVNYHTHTNEKVIFLISGNLHRNKRQDLVLEAVKRLQQQGAEGFEVWIAGGAGSMKDSQIYEQELHQFVEENKLDKVKILGRIQDMNALRSKTDVEIVASTMEGFGRVTIEAMLSANPVLASNAGANPELIRENETGWLFETGSAQSLAGKMLEIIQNKEMISPMGNKAFAFAKEGFLSEKNTKEIEALYKRITK